MIRLSPGLAMNHRFQFNPKNPTLLLTQIDPRRRSLSRIKPRSGGDGVVFDSAAYESERLRLDAAAMEDMAETAKNELESDIETDPKAWKWIIRKKIWDLMESRKYSMSPRPLHHRIPNFVGASIAATKVRDFMC